MSCAKTVMFGIRITSAIINRLDDLITVFALVAIDVASSSL